MDTQLRGGTSFSRFGRLNPRSYSFTHAVSTASTIGVGYSLCCRGMQKRKVLPPELGGFEVESQAQLLSDQNSADTGHWEWLLD